MTQMSADKKQSSFQRMLESGRKHYSLLMKEGWFTGFMLAQEWRETLV